VASRRPRASALLVAAAALMVGAAACDDCIETPRVAVDSVQRLDYPSCGPGELPEGEIVASGELGPSPHMPRERIWERFEIRRRDCLLVYTARLHWALGVADVEVVFDEHSKPLRAWMRMLLPDEANPMSTADIRLYEMRTDPTTLTHRTRAGETEYRELPGGDPVAVFGPGRGLLSVWIRAADLDVGEKTRGPVLDFRKRYESVETVALKREKDQHVDFRDEPVRAYTVFGRETVLTDDRGVVIGDLAGTRPIDVLKAEPPRTPGLPPPDPVGTP